MFVLPRFELEFVFASLEPKCLFLYEPSSGNAWKRVEMAGNAWKSPRYKQTTDNTPEALAAHQSKLLCHQSKTTGRRGRSDRVFCHKECLVFWSLPELDNMDRQHRMDKDAVEAVRRENCLMSICSLSRFRTSM